MVLSPNEHCQTFGNNGKVEAKNGHIVYLKLFSPILILAFSSTFRSCFFYPLPAFSVWAEIETEIGVEIEIEIQINCAQVSAIHSDFCFKDSFA